MQFGKRIYNLRIYCFVTHNIVVLRHLLEIALLHCTGRKAKEKLLTIHYSLLPKAVPVRLDMVEPFRLTGQSLVDLWSCCLIDSLTR